MTDFLAIIPPWLVKRAIDALPSMASARQLLPYFISIVLVVSGQALFRFSWRRSLIGMSRRVEYLLRNDLFAHLQQFDRAFFMSRPVGDLMSRCTNDLQAIQQLIAFFGLLVVDSSLTIGACLVLIIIIDPVLAIVSLLPLPMLSAAFLYFGRSLRQRSTRVQEELARLTHMVQESLAGIRVLQAYTMERVREDQYREATEQYIRSNLKLASIRGAFFATITLLVGIAGVIVLWFGGLRVIDGHLTLGGFVAFNTYLTMLLWPMMSLGFMVNLFQRGKASLGRLAEIFQHKSHIAEPERPVIIELPQGELRFEGVSFRYPLSDRWALSDISLNVPVGRRIGITGPVGCGKTTFLDLVPRIFDPTKGVILMDGYDLRSISLKDLRRWVALVAQEPFLFSDTIAENVRFPIPDRPWEDVSSITALVRLDKDEDAFPQGWDTLVGERGVMISGGQRQRIALARALVKEPLLLILDDAFAHLDEETEAEIFGNILETLPGTTILFTSHRISSLLKADRLVVLSEGRVVQEGPPEVLLETPGYFQRICRQQELISDLERIQGG